MLQILSMKYLGMDEPEVYASHRWTIHKSSISGMDVIEVLNPRGGLITRAFISIFQGMDELEVLVFQI